MPIYYDDNGNPLSAPPPAGAQGKPLGTIYYDDNGKPLNLPDSLAGRAAARLPRMQAEASAAQQDVKNDTIGRGVGQAAGAAVFGLPADMTAKALDHPILSAATMGQYPILAAMLPGMVKSAKNQVTQAGNDVRTAATGNAGPNLPPATLQQRGVAAARVPVRLLSAALAPAGVAGVADAADAIATDPNPMTAAGRFGGSAAMVGGAIPVSRLVGGAVQKSGANLGVAATDQMRNIFTETPKNAPLLDRAVPELIDKRVTFSTPDQLAARAGEESAARSVPVRGPNGRMMRQPGRQPWMDAEQLSNDIPDSQTPGQIIGDSAKSSGKALAEGVAGYLARKAGLPLGGEIGMAHAGLQLGRIAVKAVKDLADSPAWNSFSAVQKARLGSLMESGAYGDAIAYAQQLATIQGADSDPQAKYYKGLMRGDQAGRQAAVPAAR